MIRDYWWGGTGGGGWSLLLHLYRSKDYYVKYVHNHYLQLALDIGVFGLILFLAILVLFYLRVSKTINASDYDTAYWAKGIALLVTLLLLHAGFDFDLSFPLLLGLFIGLIASLCGDLKPLWKISFPSMRFYSILSISLTMTILFSWLTMGYAYKQAAIKLVHDEKWTAAASHFSSAQRLLPWSHTILYESAKGNILLGNQTKDMNYYRLAQNQLEAALELVPEHTLYQGLLTDLNRIQH
jgi:hypothetical protein